MPNTQTILYNLLYKLEKSSLACITVMCAKLLVAIYKQGEVLASSTYSVQLNVSYECQVLSYLGQSTICLT